MIIKNPELIKSIKLEFNWLRFIIPAFILLLFCLVSYFQEPKSWQYTYSIASFKASILEGYLYFYGFVFTVIWGFVLLINSLRLEIEHKTWDFVRLSQVSPIKFFVGKFIGVPIIVWILTIFFVFPLLYFASLWQLPEEANLICNIQKIINAYILSILSWVVIVYSIPFIAIFGSSDRNLKDVILISAFFALILSLFLGGYISESMRDFKRVNSIEGYQPLAKYKYAQELPKERIVIKENPKYFIMPVTREVTWYGKTMFEVFALSMTLLFFACWTVIGAYRCTTKSLMFKLSPIIWCLFLITGTLFIFGFDFRYPSYQEVELNRVFILPIVFLLFCLYITLFREAEYFDYQKLKIALNSKSLKIIFSSIPLWFFAFFTILIVCVSGSIFDFNRLNLFCSFSIIGILLRDLLFMHGISFNKSIRRKSLAFAIYFIIFCGVFPVIENSLIGYYKYSSFYPILTFKTYKIDSSDFSYYWVMLLLQMILAFTFITISKRNAK